jgi:hypothetical protein
LLLQSIEGDDLLNNSDYTDDEDAGPQGPPMGLQSSSVSEAVKDLIADTEEEFVTDIDMQNMAQSCAMEHRIFLKAALELLTERERMAVEASLQRDGPDRVLKSGILKKSSQLMKGIWKVKYAEIKKGVFVYYDDESSQSSGSKSNESSPVRKFIPLVSGEVKIRPVKLKKLAKAHNKSGYFFELSVIPEGPKRLWMISTREERQAWMKAIDDAIVGGSPMTKSDAFADYLYSADNRTASGVNENSPYRHCLDKYLAVQQQLKSACKKQAYMGGLSILWRDPLRIPVQWIRIKMGGNTAATEASGGFHAFHEEGTNQSIQQLWKDLVRDSVSINDHIIRGGDGHGPERILGTLTKCILDHDESRLKQSSASHSVRRKHQMNESQGISYARDILLACNRTRSAGDSYYSMDMLCGNPELVVLCPVSSEALPLKIIVKLSCEDKSSKEKTSQESGTQKSWVSLRGSDKKNNQWQKLFCMLSEGVMSYYEKELPTPQKLRGQLILVGAKMGACEVSGDRTFAESDRTRKKLMKLIGESQQSCTDLNRNDFQGRCFNKGKWFLIGVVSKTGAKDVQLCFQEQTDFMKWKEAIQSAIESSRDTRANRSHKHAYNFDSIDEEQDDDSSTKGKDDTDRVAFSDIQQPLVPGHPTVQVTVEASTAYRICTIDPQGDDEEDTWA